MNITDEDLPGLYQAADQMSGSGQRRYLKAAGIRFGLVILAAVGGVLVLHVGGLDIGGVVVALALICAVFVEFWLLSEKPEQAWYDGRALAESARTLAWRFAVQGAPYTATDRDDSPEKLFVEELNELLQDAPDTGIAPHSAPAVSPAMRNLRCATFEERKRSYIDARISRQQRWYASRARKNRRLAKAWRVGIIGIEFGGIVVALLRVFGYIDFDLAGVFSAMICAGVGWRAIKQYDFLDRAYTFASNELTIVRSRLELVTDDGRWADEVSDAEEAISREHTMWRASRSSRFRRP